ncbi:MAG: hypothetical protein U1E65_01620 [Myxococcota bacterium]
MSPVLPPRVRSPPPTWARLLADRIHEALASRDAIRVEEALENLAWLSQRDLQRLLELLGPEARRLILARAGPRARATPTA